MGRTEEDWKAKYKELALEVELKAENGFKAEHALRQLLNHLLMVLQGESDEMDRAIANIKPLLANPVEDFAGLARKSQQLEKLLQRHESSRNAQARKAVVAIQKWLKLLLSAGPGEAKRKRLEQLEQDSLKVTDSIYWLGPLLSELVEYQLQEHRPVTTQSEPSADISPLSPLTDSTDLLQRVGEELRQLLTGITVADERKAIVAELLQKLESGISLPDLPSLVNRLAGLILQASGNGNEDFERYLIELSQRLAEVQSSVVSSRDAQLSGAESQKQLDSQVQQNVSDLTAAMNNSIDLNQLKQAVSEQLSGLQQAMSDFKTREQSREAEMQQRHDELVQKISQLENEAGKVREHMEVERLRARTDPLTGLPNRAAYEDHLLREYQRWVRYGIPFSIAVADLDDFKSINDSFGHLAGDKVLRLVGKLIRTKLRATDFAARIGGEEFVLILPSSDCQGSEHAMDKLRHMLEQSPFNFGGKPVKVTMSFGISGILKGDSPEDVFARADEALYQAKADGRNCVRSK